MYCSIQRLGRTIGPQSVRGADQVLIKCNSNISSAIVINAPHRCYNPSIANGKHTSSNMHELVGQAIVTSACLTR
jgi:hypothetical protein